MIPVYQQLVNFLVTVGLGVVIGLLFDLYYSIRKIIKPSRVIVHIGDLLIWVVITILVFIILLLTNWADVRFYVFIGIALGLLIYYLVFSNHVKKIYDTLLKLILRLLNMLQFILLFPFRILRKLLLNIFGLISTFIKKITRPIRNLINKPVNSLKIKIKKLINKGKNN
jgi:spore cortex biosynthesis protein YabQ